MIYLTPIDIFTSSASREFLLWKVTFMKIGANKLRPTPQMLVSLSKQFDAAGDRATAALLRGIARTLPVPDAGTGAAGDTRAPALTQAAA